MREGVSIDISEISWWCKKLVVSGSRHLPLVAWGTCHQRLGAPVFGTIGVGCLLLPGTVGQWHLPENNHHEVLIDRSIHYMPWGSGGHNLQGAHKEQSVVICHRLENLCGDCWENLDCS